MLLDGHNPPVHPYVTLGIPASVLLYKNPPVPHREEVTGG